ncbi:hypothetical protein HMPREF0262_00377 [Clostridium sp. ATCC 29733]|nr:hypothetical protein HMPREF0262_00377 [Clostridium sp. ATCC 29733]
MRGPVFLLTKAAAFWRHTDRSVICLKKVPLSFSKKSLYSPSFLAKSLAQAPTFAVQ